jgi:hypothetical protein
MDLDPTGTSGLIAVCASAAAGVGRLIFDFWRWRTDRRDRRRRDYRRGVPRMTAPGGWCVEVILLDRLDGYSPVVRYRVMRHSVHVAARAARRARRRAGGGGLAPQSLCVAANRSASSRGVAEPVQLCT